MPAMISWPGHLPQGEVRDQVTAGYDWLPTLAQLCDVKLPSSVVAELDGQSLTEAIRSATAPSRTPSCTGWRASNGLYARETGS